MLHTLWSRKLQSVHAIFTCISTHLGIRLVGAPVAGRISDKIIVKYRSRRGGEWVPEDRLRATLVGAAIFVPFSILCSGLLTQFVEGKVGLVLNLICLFLNGFGVRSHDNILFLILIHRDHCRSTWF